MTKPDPLDFVNVSEEVTEEFAEKVTVNGHEYPLTEFTQAERHLWLKVRDDANLTGVIKDFGEIRRKLDDLTGGTLVEKKEARIKKLNEEIDKFIDGVGFDEWKPEHDDRLNRMITMLDEAKKEVQAIQAPLEDKALEESSNLNREIEDLRERQNLVHLKFMWLLAKQRHHDARSWEDYVSDAKGSDRLNAAEVISAGNFTWENQPQQTRMNRAARRNRKS